MRGDLLSRLMAVVRSGQPAGRDPATGFFDRRALRHEAMAMLPAQLEGAAMLLVAFDGAVPADFAPDLLTLLHPGDTPYRAGPASIAVLMPRTALRHALGTAEHVRMIAEVEMQAPVAVGIGIAMAEACGYDLEVLLAAAEGAAAEARRRGGNRIVVAGPTPPLARAG